MSQVRDENGQLALPGVRVSGNAVSSFDVDETGGDGSLNPNSTYDGWCWILVRNTGGRWKHVDHGYG